MSKFKSILIAGLVGVFVMASVCNAGSIWAKRSRNSKPIYADDKANQIGDILTIIIAEDSSLETDVTRDLTSSSSRKLTFTGDTPFDKAPFSWLPGIPGVTDPIDISSSRSKTGDSGFTDERTYEDKITVVVEDIHPNGNLIVIGTRSRDIANDKQTVQVSGIVRPRDITFDNTVRSEQVANFKLVTINEGVSEDYNQPGWLSAILDALWPF